MQLIRFHAWDELFTPYLHVTAKKKLLIQNEVRVVGSRKCYEHIFLHIWSTSLSTTTTRSQSERDQWKIVCHTRTAHNNYHSTIVWLQQVHLQYSLPCRYTNVVAPPHIWARHTQRKIITFPANTKHYWPETSLCSEYLWLLYNGFGVAHKLYVAFWPIHTQMHIEWMRKSRYNNTPIILRVYIAVVTKDFQPDFPIFFFFCLSFESG